MTFTGLVLEEQYEQIIPRMSFLSLNQFIFRLHRLLQVQVSITLRHRRMATTSTLKYSLIIVSTSMIISILGSKVTPQQRNQKARLISATYPATNQNSDCFKFWYHMYGAGIGALNVSLKQIRSEIEND